MLLLHRLPFKGSGYIYGGLSYQIIRDWEVHPSIGLRDSVNNLMG